MSKRKESTDLASDKGKEVIEEEEDGPEDQLEETNQETSEEINLELKLEGADMEDNLPLYSLDEVDKIDNLDLLEALQKSLEEMLIATKEKREEKCKNLIDEKQKIIAELRKKQKTDSHNVHISYPRDSSSSTSSAAAQVEQTIPFPVDPNARNLLDLVDAQPESSEGENMAEVSEEDEEDEV